MLKPQIISTADYYTQIGTTEIEQKQVYTKHAGEIS